MTQLQELGPGDERKALSYLEADAFRNLRIIWALRRWGLFNLGLPEQGKYLVARVNGNINGLLFLNNLGLLRLAAPKEVALQLMEKSLLLWGLPGLLVGPQDEVDFVLSRFNAMEGAIEHVEEEVTMILSSEDFKPYGKKATLALLEDVDDLAELEKLMQLEMLGISSADWVIRSQIIRAIEDGAASLVRHGGHIVAKAEMDATTPAIDELGGVYTVSSKRRKGYAWACCSFLCQLSLSRGKRVRLETQRDNLAALQLYDLLGFRPLWPHLTVRFKSRSR